jgi:hypothetical protein
MASRRLSPGRCTHRRRRRAEGGRRSPVGVTASSVLGRCSRRQPRRFVAVADSAEHGLVAA